MGLYRDEIKTGVVVWLCGCWDGRARKEAAAPALPACLPALPVTVEIFFEASEQSAAGAFCVPAT